MNRHQLNRWHEMLSWIRHDFEELEAGRRLAAEDVRDSLASVDDLLGQLHNEIALRDATGEPEDHYAGYCIGGVLIGAISGALIALAVI